MQSGTDARCNNPNVDETWLCGRWRHRGWSKNLEAFAGEIPECRDNVSGDFVCTTRSTAARWSWGFRYVSHQRTGVDHKVTKRRGSSLREPFLRFGPKWFADEVLKFCYTRSVQPGWLTQNWWKFCQGLQGEVNNASSVVRRAPKQSMQETKRWRPTWVNGNGSNIGYIRQGIRSSS